MYNRAYVLFILILCNAPYAFSQDDCAFALRKAEKLYESGLMEQIPPTLNPCLENGSTGRAEKEQAYKLLILSGIFTEKLSMANNNMLKLLKLSPEYQVAASSPQEFVHLFKQYRTAPLVALGLFAGPNLTAVRVREEYGVHDLKTAVADYPTVASGFQMGIRYLQYLSPSLQLNIDAYWKRYNLQYTNTILDFAQINFTETQSTVELPITLIYNLKFKRTSPYFRLGACLSYLYLSNADVSRSFVNDTKAPISTSSIDLTPHRKRLNYSAIAGIGIKLKVNMGNLFIGADYLYGISNRVEPSERYATPALQFNYYYIDDDFSTNNIMLNIGYTRSFYKPKKRRQNSTVPE